MGWTEREYYESSPESVYYAFQGYFDKRKVEENWFRTLAWIEYKAAGGKESSIENFWKIDGEKKEVVRKVWGHTPEEIAENIRKVKEAHKIK